MTFYPAMHSKSKRTSWSRFGCALLAFSALASVPSAGQSASVTAAKVIDPLNGAMPTSGPIQLGGAGVVTGYVDFTLPSGVLPEREFDMRWRVADTSATARHVRTYHDPSGADIPVVWNGDIESPTVDA